MNDWKEQAGTALIILALCVGVGSCSLLVSVGEYLMAGLPHQSKAVAREGMER